MAGKKLPGKSRVPLDGPKGRRAAKAKAKAQAKRQAEPPPSASRDGRRDRAAHTPKMRTHPQKIVSLLLAPQVAINLVFRSFTFTAPGPNSEARSD